MTAAPSAITRLRVACLVGGWVDGWDGKVFQLRALLTQMRKVASEASQLIMNEAANRRAKVQSKAEPGGGKNPARARR